MRGLEQQPAQPPARRDQIVILLHRNGGNDLEQSLLGRGMERKLLRRVRRFSRSREQSVELRVPQSISMRWRFAGPSWSMKGGAQL